MNILSELSGWMYFPVVFTGLAYAAILYFKNKKLPFSKNVQYLLFVLRFVVVSLIAFLLLGPYLMRTKKNVEQPILLFAQDNSSSIALNVDSMFYKNDYALKLDSLTNQFDDDYTVERYIFGQKVIKSSNVNFLDQRTDFSALLKELKNTYYNRNVGALVLFSDGIYNSGVQPELLAEALPFPIYTVGLGDTLVHPDVNIADLRYNRLIYNKTDFPVEVTVKAIDALGEKLKISLFMEDEKVGEHEFLVASKRFSVSSNFMISAGQSGRKKMRALVTGVENETVLLNNKRDFYIEIINQKQSILILAKAPHPDLAAIKAVFEDNFDVTIAFVQSWKPGDKQYNLLILHELPGEGINNISINDFIIKNKSLPILFIIGNQTDIEVFNRIQDVVQYKKLGQDGGVDALPQIDPAFALFSLETFQKERIRKFPALKTLLLEYNSTAIQIPFLNQRIKGLETNYPLIGFSENVQRRVGVISGTGMWRWRLADYNQNGNHETFNDLIEKTCNYLVLKQDNRRLRLYTEAEFMLNDEIHFKAELYNQSLEMVNDVDVKMLITNIITGATFDFVFSRTEQSYFLNASRLPTGEYAFVAEADLGNEHHKYEGSFVVIESSLEGQNLLANHHLLFRIAYQTGGKFVPVNEMMKLSQMLKDDKQITSVATFTKQYESLSSLMWMFALILALLTTEWLLRKIFGSY